MSKKNTLKELINKKATSNMIIISDVDGVHTSPKTGARISARPSDKFGALFTVKNDVEVLELIPANKKVIEKELSIGGFVEEDIMEFYTFHTPDGQAILNLSKNKIRTIIVSGRNAAPVRNRFDYKLGAETYLGVRNKLEYFSQEKFSSIDFKNSIFISDGHQDVPLLKAIRDAGGISIATADGEAEAIAAAEVTTIKNGGEGAFAEVALTYLNFINKK